MLNSAVKKYLLNRKIQKLFLPIAFVCILPLWVLLARDSAHVPGAVYALGALAALAFILDRFFKPWETERAEAKMKTAQQAVREEQPPTGDGA